MDKIHEKRSIGECCESNLLGTLKNSFKEIAQENPDTNNQKRTEQCLGFEVFYYLFESHMVLKEALSKQNVGKGLKTLPTFLIELILINPYQTTC